MRLINTKTLKLEEFVGDQVPPYAILSHTWEEGEVTLQELCSRSFKVKRKKGYSKIVKTCKIAKEDKLDYAWVDTCCIDKTSSAELSEAINSMFQWYRKAKVCYAYLTDLSAQDVFEDGLRKCKWFTRGWTLQELIAPDNIVFYDSDWQRRGEKAAHFDILRSITGITTDILMPSNMVQEADPIHAILSRTLVAERMAWASRRQTTRREDMAYCLLGIFNIHMPLLYGEGERAFYRLQEQIASQSSDSSLLAWRANSSCSPCSGVLAPHISCFDYWSSPDVNVDYNLVYLRSIPMEFTVTNRKLRISANALQKWSNPNLPSELNEFGEPLLGYYLQVIRSPTSNVKNSVVIALVRAEGDCFVRYNGEEHDYGLSFQTVPSLQRLPGYNQDISLDMNPDLNFQEVFWNRWSWISLLFSSELQVVRAIPASKWDMGYSRISIYPETQVLFVISCDQHDGKPIWFILHWDVLELANGFRIINYSEPAARYLLHNTVHTSIDDFENHGGVVPAKEMDNTLDSRTKVYSDIDTDSGRLRVTILIDFNMVVKPQGIEVSCAYLSDCKEGLSEVTLNPDLS